VENDQFFYHANHLGSTNFVTDANGALYEHLEYFPFGETWVQESSNTQRTPYLFTGKELDEETGLYDYGARYYDPRTSQFISTDPLLQSDPGKTTSTSAGLSLYAYAINNPMRYIDPTGRDIALPTDEKKRMKVFNAAQKLSSDTLAIEQQKDGSYLLVIKQQAQSPQYYVGTQLIRNLIKSKQVVTVSMGGAAGTTPVYDKEGRYNAAVNWSEAEFDDFIVPPPSWAPALPGVTEAQRGEAYITLGHEFVHAWYIMTGRNAYGKEVDHAFQFGGQRITEKVRPEELLTVGIERNPKRLGMTGARGEYRYFTENAIRKEHGLPPRVAYMTKEQIPGR
jgi:RHS repeat-associated protein